jgi:prepilin-type N-terminal cleavage/methylation domain-containing protein
MHHKRAFSLIEMMVVIGIIAVLLTILGRPLFDLGLRSGYISVCASNENQLYIAAQAYRSANNRPLAAVYWQENLLPYLEDNRDVFICPEDESPFAELQESGVTIDVYDWCYTNFRGNLPLFEWERPIGFGGGAQGWRRKDVKPGVYQLWMEDGWNSTWNDLILEIDETVQGQVKVTYAGENTGGSCGGWRYNMLDTLGNKLTPLDDMGASPDISGSQFGESVIVQLDKGFGSYGMNLAAKPGFTGYNDGKWIMFLDYYKLQADAVGDDWAGELTQDGTHGFARHLNGICNVLTMDGSIRQRSSHELDPTFVERVYKYWNPDP